MPYARPDFWTVYRLTCTVSGKAYIGITRFHPNERWLHHRHHAVSEGRRTALGAAIRKYGAENFVLETLATAPDDVEAVALERAFIVAYGTLTPKGYNLTSGGEFAKNITEEVRQKMRGRVVSAETRAKISHNNKNRIVSAETRAKMSASRKGKKLGPASPEAHESMRLAWSSTRVPRPKLSPEERQQRRREQAQKRRLYPNLSAAELTAVRIEAARLANTGRKRSPAVVAKIVAFHSGRKRSIETRAKISIAARGRRLKACHNGHAYTQENTFINHRGHQKCRICLAAKERRSTQAAK